MSLRIITQPAQISQWIADRNGIPVRRHAGKTDLQIVFTPPGDDFETLTIDELLQAMKFDRLVMLVDQEPGKTFYKLYAHS